MNNIEGLEIIHGLPFQKMEYVGTLLFSLYPSTIVFKDNHNEPIIKEWVDCSDDDIVDRFFYYAVNKENLIDFIEGLISHLDLINSAINGYVFFQDETGDKILNTKILSINTLPIKYIPANDFYFRIEDGVDTNLILNDFNLSTIEIGTPLVPSKVKETAKRSQSETLYIHFRNGKSVGHGSIKTEVYGQALLTIDKFYKSVALDHLKTKDRGEIYLDAFKNQSYLPYVETEVYGGIIENSYGFMIRPVRSLINTFIETPNAQISSKIIGLITNSKNTEELKQEYILHSRFTINAYEEFLNEVYQKQLVVEINWFNPKTNIEISADIDYLKANKIIQEIKQLSVSAVNEIKMTGKFRAIDCDSAHFTFTSTDGQKYSGYFGKGRRDALDRINFIDVYKIIIQREVTKKPGKDDKITDTIISYFLDSGNEV